MRHLILISHLCCSMLFIISCTIDSVKDLGNGYFYRDEGGDIKDILCDVPNGGEIPSTILKFSYNEEFIIASQKPKLPQDPLYDKEYEYKNGNDFIYYWIIIKNFHTVIGPLDKTEYLRARAIRQIPEDLKIE